MGAAMISRVVGVIVRLRSADFVWTARISA
jgi:hypothetical protein